MTKPLRAGLIVAVVVLLAVLEYFFRPELLFVDTQVNEEAPVALVVPSPAPTSAPSSAPSATPQPTPAVMKGPFMSGEHETSGLAEYLGTVVRLTDFSTSNGPDVRVYLLPGGDVADKAAIKAGNFVDLGVLKGNKGNQNYEIPEGTDLSKYGRVSIWCRRFSVPFGHADIK
ncbi:DM13 domain-containing protein [soil metagenome]